MSEGRRSQVVLLDERRLELLVQPRLFAGELLDLVASHFHLKEKEYFGIAYLNDTNQYSWLQLDKRVLDHEFPKKSATGPAPALTLYFRVKYYVESITQLRDSATVEAFYLQAKSLLSKGELEADSETVFQLAALVLQATYGDYVDDATFRSHLRRLPILPTTTLKECPSITHCEEKVLEHYKALIGQSRGDAIVNYLTIVESLPTYGQHYYEVKDKTGSICWLGLSYKGISQYEKSNRRSPSRVFLWKQLENLYFRDKKFTIEVHEARRVIHTLSSFNLYEDAIEEPVEDYDDLSDAICDPTTQVSVSRRTLAPANVTVYVWYAISPVITKCIWSMAIAQHHFFLDRRHQKSQTKLAPCLSQIATELCRSVQSLNSVGSLSNISRSTSSSSLPSTILGGEISEESKAATIEMLAALRARKEALEEALKKKNEELKTLCLREGELTGEIPPEIPLLPGEDRPQVRRRIGTSFSLSDKLICKVKNKERETLSDIELEYEIQSKIASAAFQLANDCTARKSVRKQRKLSYVQATAKLRNLELKLNALRKQRIVIAEQSDSGSEDSESGLSTAEKVEDHPRNHLVESLSTSRSLSSHSASDTVTLRSSIRSSSSVPPCSSLPHLAVPVADNRTDSSSKGRQRHQSLQHVPFTNAAEVDGDECDAPCEWSVASYCPGLELDTVTNAGAVPLRTPFKNRFESRLDIEGSNLYSVRNRRASQVFDSQDDLLLGGRKSDLEKRSPSANIHINHLQYSNIPLSASYDERLWCGQSKDMAAAASSDCSSLEASFDAHSTNGCDNYFDTHCHNPVTIELPKNSPKLHHFYSEHSLHREEFGMENSLAKEKEIINPLRKVPLVQSVPHLHAEVSTNQELYMKNLTSSNNLHSLNQVADLVNASMLRQGGKKSSTLSHASCLSPKTKTKEWIETSLDSPTPVRKSKSRPSCDSPVKNEVLSNIYPYERCIRLSPYPQECSYPDIPTPAPQVQKARHPSEYSVSMDDQWAVAETSSLQSVPYSPVQLRKKQTCDFQEVPKDFASHLHSSNDLDAYNYSRNQEPITNGHATASLSPIQNYSHDVIPDASPMPSFECQPNIDICTGPADNFTIQNPPPNYMSMSHDSLFHNAALSPCQDITSSHPSTSSNLGDKVHYKEATVVDIPQEIVESLSPRNGTSFIYPGNVEVNVVSLGHFQPYWEETKPYEISDFYKYSTKHRKPQHKSLESVPKQPSDPPWLERRNPDFVGPCDPVIPEDMDGNPHIVNQSSYTNLDISSMYGADPKRNIVTSPQSIGTNDSFGEVGIRVSVADTFHDEMLAWYENRDHVKKATLV